MSDKNSFQVDFDSEAIIIKIGIEEVAEKAGCTIFRYLNIMHA